MPAMPMPPVGCYYKTDTTTDTVTGCLKNPGGILTCEPTIPPAVQQCGNGIKQGGEECDDRNRKPGDGCSTNCEIEDACGDYAVTRTLGEECDFGPHNGEAINNFECSTQCRWEYCGDKFVQSYLGEICDGTEGCSLDCKPIPKTFCSYQPKGLGRKCEEMLATTCASFGGQQYESIDACNASIPVCGDGKDNDADGTIDLNDKGCSSSSDTDEGDGNTDIAVAIKAVPGPIPVDSAYGVTLSTKNLGPDHATHPVTIDVSIPANAYYEPQNSERTCRQDGGVVHCIINPMVVGTTYVAQLTFHVNKDAQCSTAITHTAKVAALSTLDPVVLNNTASVSITTKCAGPTCLDSDGPENYNTMGNVTGNQVYSWNPTTQSSVRTSPVNDYCEGNRVYDAACVLTCKPGDICNYFNYFDCQYGCADGACKKAPVVNCTDSDGGNVPETFGTVTNLMPAAKEKDTCIDATSLKERVCENDQLMTKPVPCPYGCADGACKKAPVACAPAPAPTNAKWQNIYNSLDVDGNRVINDVDVKSITYFMTTYGQGTPGANVVSPLRPDVNGDNSVDAQDALLAGTHVTNNCGQQSITLNAPATLSCIGNVSTVTLNYATKYMYTNVHVLPENGYTPITSYSPTAVTGTFPYAALVGATANTKVRLCHGNDYNVCSSAVAIQGTGCATTSSTNLVIAMKAMAATNTVVRNQKGVPMLKFDATSTAGDSYLSNVVVRAAEGTLANATNYSLWAWKNGSVSITHLNATVQNGLIRFQPTETYMIGEGAGMRSYQIPKDGLVNFEVRADIASSTVSNTLRLELATMEQNYVTANRVFTPGGGSSMDALTGIKTNGTCPVSSCQIIVTTVASTKFTIIPQGNLFVTLDTTPVRQRQLLASALSDVAFRVNMLSENDDIKATKLRFVTIGGRGTSIDSLELVKVGETLPFASATVAGCTDFSVTTYEGNPSQTFCATLSTTPTNQLVIPRGQSVVVLVKARMKSDDQGAISNEPIQLAIDTSGGGGGGVGQPPTMYGFVEATSVTSNNALSADNIYIGTSTATGLETAVRSPKHVSVLAKLDSIAKDPTADVDNTNVPTGFASIGRFSLKAAANTNTKNGLNKVALNSITARITSTNVDYQDFNVKLYNAFDATIKVPCTLKSQITSGTPPTKKAYVECANLQNSGGDFTLDSGETGRFYLETNIVNSKVNAAQTSSIQVSLENFSDPNVQNGFIPWQDKDAGSGIQTFQWFEYPETVVNSTLYKS